MEQTKLAVVGGNSRYFSVAAWLPACRCKLGASQPRALWGLEVLHNQNRDMIASITARSMLRSTCFRLLLHCGTDHRGQVEAPGPKQQEAGTKFPPLRFLLHPLCPRAHPLHPRAHSLAPCIRPNLRHVVTSPGAEGEGRSAREPFRKFRI